MYHQMEEAAFDFEVDDTLGNAGAAAGAGAIVDRDAAINGHEFFHEEHDLFQDRLKKQEWGDYHRGETTKKKNKTMAAKRAAAANPSKQYGDDFDTKKNKYYDDVHTHDAKVAASTAVLTNADKEKFKEKLKALVDKRSGSVYDLKTKGFTMDAGVGTSEAAKKAALKVDAPLPGESVQQFLARRKAAEAGAALESNNDTSSRKRKTVDPNNYDWILSGNRNASQARHMTSSASLRRQAIAKTEAAMAGEKMAADAADDADADVITKKIKVAKPTNDWIAAHRESSKGAGAAAAAAAAPDEEEELMVQVPRKEIEHMQKLTEKLYGKAIGQEEYMDEVALDVRKRIVASASRGSKMGGDGDDENDEFRYKATWVDETTGGVNSFIGAESGAGVDLSLLPGFGDENGTGDAGGGNEFDAAAQVKRDASNKKHLAPRIKWAQTPYGSQSSEKCMLSIDPYQFLTTRSSKRKLMDDLGVRMDFECEARSLIAVSTKVGQSIRVFASMRQWAEAFDNCDIVYYHSVSYTARYRRSNDEIRRLLREAGKGEEARDEYQYEVHKRLVVFHDLRNGFFVCNHFELVPKQSTQVGATVTAAKATEAKASNVALFSKEAAEGKTGSEKDHATVTDEYNFLWFGYCYMQYV